MNPYSYRRVDYGDAARLVNTTKNCRMYQVKIPSAVQTKYPESSTITGEYYQVKERNAPVIILVHGVGDFSTIPCRLLARSLSSRGFACFVPYLMVHSSRMPQSFKLKFPVLSGDDWFETYQTSVVDIRQVVDWLEHREELGAQKIGVLGISFGGFVSSIAMGIDSRIKAGAFIVSGGNGGKLNQLSKVASLKAYRRSKDEYLAEQAAYYQYLSQVKSDGFENVAPPQRYFMNDPMTFAHRLPPRPVLMVNARWDEAVPREAALDFWREAGQPPIIWYPTAHASLWFWYPLIALKVARFFKSAFAK